MKMQLGGKVIKLNRVHKAKRIGARGCIIEFHTGESIRVVCGVEVPDGMAISYKGSADDLIAFINSNKGD